MAEQYKKNIISRIVCIVALITAFFAFGTLQVQASEAVSVSTEQELVNAIENAKTATVINLEIPGKIKVIDISNTLVIPQEKMQR